MPREVYDPKKPELEFYNKRERRVYREPPKVKPSIFSKKKFMFFYGAFLSFFVIIFFMIRSGFLDNIPFFAALRVGNNPLEVKINNIDFYQKEEAIIPTIEVKNLKYTNEINIKNLKVNYSLYKNKKLVFNGNDNFYNISFPSGQRIGFKIQFDKTHWNNANKLEIVLNLDDNLVWTNNINISRLKK